MGRGEQVSAEGIGEKIIFMMVGLSMLPAIRADANASAALEAVKGDFEAFVKRFIQEQKNA